MKKSIVKVACAVLILLMVVAGASACNSARVEQVAGGALQAIVNDDYEAYMGYFIPEDRPYLTESQFHDTNRLLGEIVGEYISSEFLEAGELYGYLTVAYNAEFTEEPAGVTVIFFFQETVSAPHYLLERMGWEELYYEELYVAGVLFDSPKIQDYLAENPY
jgi:hypothetical protein